MDMENEKPKEIKKAPERPFYGSQEQPTRTAPDGSSSQGPIKGKPRPSSS